MLVPLIRIKKEEEEKKVEGNVQCTVVIVFIFLVHSLYCCVTFTHIFIHFTLLKFYRNTAVFRIFQKEEECNYFSNFICVVCAVAALCSSDSSSLSFPYSSCS
jgi:hypothetical protein